ncbi:hypothetical protein DW352_05280 [Pseudolabrys taiwanensis]|uniref:Uncharacterized protein n=1 Tax=Pseudolabrys taiwanensis TaxID=331696 RepID=A0A345ZST5_9HYPH|nr:hypothetical protein DW352_05280 [Pseudolabrys taiwanensis]
MIDRQGGRIVIECDSCDETFDGNSIEGDGDDWQEVWPAAKAEGWTSKKIGNEWVHGCPHCGVYISAKAGSSHTLLSSLRTVRPSRDR